MKNINCENYLCVYFYNGFCRLENITLSVGGLCNSCIYIDIDEKYLDQQRKKIAEIIKKLIKFYTFITKPEDTFFGYSSGLFFYYFTNSGFIRL